MTTTSNSHFTLDQKLFLDRRLARYTFRENPDTVLVVNAFEPVSLDDLEALFYPYKPRKISAPLDMLDRDVRKVLADQGFGEDPAMEDRQVEEVEVEEELQREPVEIPEEPIILRPDTEELQVDELFEDVAQSTEREKKRIEILGPVDDPVKKQVGRLKSKCDELINEWLEAPGGSDAIIGGNYDTEIRDVVTQLCQEVKPRNLLQNTEITSGPRGEGPSESGEKPMEKAVVSQAFGNELDLDEMQLFMLAKSAILQTLSRTGYQNILDIKQHLLLRGPSPSLETKLCQYYNGIERYLSNKKVDPELINLVSKSKFIYLHGENYGLEPQSIALGVSDAYLTLKQAGKLNIEILNILPSHMQTILPKSLANGIDSAESLLRETCYKEYRKAFCSGMSGGDHCDFYTLPRNRYGILIFDVSGHEERASNIRDNLVQVLNKIENKSDAGRLMTVLNRYCLKVPLPADIFVSGIYAILDVNEKTLTYANAGHHPPMLVRGDDLLELDDTGDMALNIFDIEYGTKEFSIDPLDCLILYTDGIIEAVHEDTMDAGTFDKQFFGKDRLEQAILKKKISQARAGDAIDMILNAAHDDGFEIEDDITIQVYRHV